MSKIALVAGGTAVVSLAAGAASGYFYAKKQFDKKLLIELETESQRVKKYYAIQVAQASSKPATPGELLVDKPEVDSVAEDALDFEDRLAAEEEADREREAQGVIIDYKGISTDRVKKKTTLETTNIFDTAVRPTPKLPPRGPGGKFQKADEDDSPKIPGPYLISVNSFAEGCGYEQFNYTYYANDNMILDYNNEVVDLSWVGEENLTKFGSGYDEEAGDSMIFVRNDKLSMDFEIQSVEEPVGPVLGIVSDDDKEDSFLPDANSAAWV